MNAEKQPTQYSIAWLLLLMCVFAIPMALVAQVIRYEKGLVITMSLGGLFLAMYGLVSVVSRGGKDPLHLNETDEASSVNRSWGTLKRPLIALVLTSIVIMFLEVIARWN